MKSITQHIQAVLVAALLIAGTLPSQAQVTRSLAWEKQEANTGQSFPFLLQEGQNGPSGPTMTLSEADGTARIRIAETHFRNTGLPYPQHLPAQDSIVLEETPFDHGGRSRFHYRLKPYRQSQSGQLQLLDTLRYTLDYSGRQKTRKAEGEEDFADNSVLASGDWFKVGITESGLYKLTAEQLRSMGLGQNLDPRRIAVFGNGGQMLPQPNSASRLDDLQENAIFFSGEADGTLNDGDYLLFYGRGPLVFDYQLGDGLFHHQLNRYTDTAYYFVTLKGEGQTGLRVPEKPAPAGTADTTFSSYQARRAHEKDQVNLLHSGRKFFGEVFDFTLQHDVDFKTPDRLGEQPLHLHYQLMAAARGTSKTTEFTVFANGKRVSEDPIAGFPDRTYTDQGVFSKQTESVELPAGDNLTVNLNYSKNGHQDAIGYLDYLTLNYESRLRYRQGALDFRQPESLGRNLSAYQIEQAPSDLQVWDISNWTRPRSLPLSRSNGSATFTDRSADTLREYLAFAGKNFPSPQLVGEVPSQNLHGMRPVDFVILTHPRFKAQAERLATHRRNHSGLATEVVTTTQVYNEYSSGAQDLVAIRDFGRMLYQKSEQRFKYLLLFGDASYDYRDRSNTGQNFVPIYESPRSLHDIFSYSSDDYVGFYDEDEGAWRSGDQDDLEIGIGRLPIKTREEAEVVVDKIINYDSNPATLGQWRNRLMFIADDGDSYVHQIQAENLSDKVKGLEKAYDHNKVFLDAFEQEATSSGEVSPQATDAIFNNLDRGVLIANYTGHGSETQLAGERMIEMSDITRWDNYNRLSFFVTATCDFGRYDDPDWVSGGESVILSPKGAGIGIITAVRPVFSAQNFNLNSSFYSAAFQRLDNGQLPRLGDVQRKTKNGAISNNNRGFSLMGDPSLRLAYPENNIALTQINGQPLNDSSDSEFSALQKVELKGEVRDFNGLPLEAYQGTVDVTIFDKPQNVKISNSFSFEVQQNTIFTGQASVDSGQFSLSFVVPKDISYLEGEGKISMYAQSSNGLRDAHGAKTDIQIGGTDTNSSEDTNPPQVQVFLNDTTFESGGITGSSPRLVALLEDENGINLSTAGIGHEITAVVNDNQEELIVLNDFYRANLDNFRKGRVDYPFRDLEPGRYKVCVKAWDTHNNSGEGCTEFVVSEPGCLKIKDLVNFPNPVENETHFRFQHNRAGEDLSVKIRIFSMQGRQVSNLHYTVPASASVVGSDGQLAWHPGDEGLELQRGLYFYRVEVSDGACSTTRTKKLLIIK